MNEPQSRVGIWQKADSCATIILGRALAPNHMWWEGEDKFGRPILYARPGEMDLSTYSREEYVKAHVYLIEQGLQRMRAGVSTFVLVVDASHLSTKHFDLARDKQLLHIGAPHCNTLQHTATHCSTLQHTDKLLLRIGATNCNTL